MEGTLGGFTSHILALLVVGLGTSVGLTFAGRTRRIQSGLSELSGRWFGAISVAALALCGWVGYFVVRSAIDRLGGEVGTIPVAHAALIGLVVGIPMGLPGLVAAWWEARALKRRAQKRRDYVPTKDDRREYAAKLVAQIEEVSPKPRELTAQISGDGGTVLRFDGDIDAAEGERLTAALREDLKDVGFKRVEGRKGTKEWWSRV